MKEIGETSGAANIKEDALKLNAEGFGKGEMLIREEDLAGSLKEIEKLDAVLKIKLTEEKKARLSRIQAEEESRDILSNLPSFKMSDRVKINVEQFMKLLDEIVEMDADSSSCFKPLDVDRIAEEPDSKGEGKEGKPSCQHASGLTFVERNIRLAKCGRGTLSLTDEEKSRIESLLVDVGDSESKTTPEATELVQTVSGRSEFYAVDGDTKSILGEIDEQLEALEQLKTRKGHEKGAVLEKSGTEKNGLEGKGKEGCKRGREQEEKRGNRLEEINKLLNSMNSASDEEVIPLPEEELESLIELSRQSLSAVTGEQPGPRLPQEVIAELVSGAKFLMPKFKYSVSFLQLTDARVSTNVKVTIGMVNYRPHQVAWKFSPVAK